MGKPFNSITLRVAVSEWLSNPEEAEQKHGHIGSWNTSLVTDMSYMFGSAFSFNQPIEKWRVRNVTNMSKMFRGAYIFNQPIGKWKVSNVKDMSNMFNRAFSLKQPIGNWDLSITDMSSMFGNLHLENIMVLLRSI
jgi:hypothetical protein